MIIIGHEPVATSLTKVTVGTPQLSVAVTCVISGAGTSVMHSTVMAAGQVITGGVISSTVIICSQVLVFPHESSAI